MTQVISPSKIQKALNEKTVVIDNGEIFFYPKNQNRGIINIVRPNAKILNDMDFAQAVKEVINL